MVDQEGNKYLSGSQTVLKPSGSAEQNTPVAFFKLCWIQKSEFFLVALKCSPVPCLFFFFPCKSFCLNLRGQTPDSWGLVIPSTRMPWSTQGQEGTRGQPRRQTLLLQMLEGLGLSLYKPTGMSSPHGKGGKAPSGSGFVS